MVVLDATDREHRAAVRAARPGLLRRRAPVDHHRLRAGVRLAAAARRPARRPVRAQVDVHRRPDRLRRRVGDRRRRRLVRRASSARAPRRARSARCSRRRRWRCCPRRSPTPHERGKAFGIFGAIAGSGAAVGLLLGGVLTEWLSWRWCLYVNLLFAIPAAARGPAPAASTSRRRDRPPIDLPGTRDRDPGLFALVYGFANSETHSWGHPVTIVMLAAGVRAARRRSW